jgi:hypothetical protein
MTFCTRVVQFIYTLRPNPCDASGRPRPPIPAPCRSWQHATAGHTRTVVTTAWTVREDASGTVTIYLQQYADPAGLQQTLRADRINAIVRQIPAVLRTVGNQTMPFSCLQLQHS